MVGQVADILIVFEGDGKCQSVKRCSLSALSGRKGVPKGKIEGIRKKNKSILSSVCRVCL